MLYAERRPVIVNSTCDILHPITKGIITARHIIFEVPLIYNSDTNS
jgi:hypothetical protein